MTLQLEFETEITKLVIFETRLPRSDDRCGWDSLMNLSTLDVVCGYTEIPALVLALHAYLIAYIFTSANPVLVKITDFLQVTIDVSMQELLEDIESGGHGSYFSSTSCESSKK